MSRTVGRPGPVGRRRLLLAVTLLAGLGSAFAVAASGPTADRTFAAAHAAAQSAMSVAVPLFGILLVGDLRRSRNRSPASGCSRVRRRSPSWRCGGSVSTSGGCVGLAR